ncbi:hypothetical protein G210_3357, partial [Candida maltosa Xu316]
MKFDTVFVSLFLASIVLAANSFKIIFSQSDIDYYLNINELEEVVFSLDDSQAFELNEDSQLVLASDHTKIIAADESDHLAVYDKLEEDPTDKYPTWSFSAFDDIESINYDDSTEDKSLFAYTFEDEDSIVWKPVVDFAAIPDEAVSEHISIVFVDRK